MGETLVGAFAGAVIGSILGYIGGYHLARRARHDEVSERRVRLMRALSHEIALEVRELRWGDVPGRLTLSTGVYLSTLEPLLDLVAELHDERLLQALAHLKSRAESFNDVVGWTNPLQTQVMTQEQLDGFHASAQGSYQQVRDAAATAVELLAIRR